MYLPPLFIILVLEVNMRIHVTIILISIAIGFSSAQLLPPQKPAEPADNIKLNRAMVFKVNYGDIPPEPDSTSRESDNSNPTVNRHRKDNHFIRNFLIGTGACITEATLGAATNSSGPVVCPLTDGLTKF